MLKMARRKVDRMRTRGTVVPSSRFLVGKMLDRLDFSQDMNVLQLGYGTGVFTAGILKRLSANSTVTVFEVDPRSRAFQIDDVRVTYVEASAEHVSQHFPGQTFDNIVSTLPFASLPRPVSLAIFAQIRAHLAPGGQLLQFQYSLVSRKDFRRIFDTEPQILFEPRNLPPAFIYDVHNGGPLTVR